MSFSKVVSLNRRPPKDFRKKLNRSLSELFMTNKVFGIASMAFLSAACIGTHYLATREPDYRLAAERVISETPLSMDGTVYGLARLVESGDSRYSELFLRGYEIPSGTVSVESSKDFWSVKLNCDVRLPNSPGPFNEKQLTLEFLDDLVQKAGLSGQLYIGSLGSCREIN